MAKTENQNKKHKKINLINIIYIAMEQVNESFLKIGVRIFPVKIMFPEKGGVG